MRAITAWFTLWRWVTWYCTYSK